VLAEVTGISGVYSDPAHIVAYTDGEIREEYEVILLGHPVSGTPGARRDLFRCSWTTDCGTPTASPHDR
jgi:hypothetical protein